MKKEPLAIITALVLAINKILDVAIQFGWDLTETQTSSVRDLLTALSGIAIVFFVRSRVSPVDAPST